MNREMIPKTLRLRNTTKSENNSQCSELWMQFSREIGRELGRQIGLTQLQHPQTPSQSPIPLREVGERFSGCEQGLESFPKHES